MILKIQCDCDQNRGQPVKTHFTKKINHKHECFLTLFVGDSNILLVTSSILSGLRTDGQPFRFFFLSWKLSDSWNLVTKRWIFILFGPGILGYASLNASLIEMKDFVAKYCSIIKIFMLGKFSIPSCSNQTVLTGNSIYCERSFCWHVTFNNMVLPITKEKV